MTDTSHYRLKGALQKTMADGAAAEPSTPAAAPAAAQDLYEVLGCAKGDDAPVFGVGRHKNITKASLSAVVSAINRAIAA